LIAMWQKIDNQLHKTFEFADFDEAFSFMEKVASIARIQNHHPKIVNTYNKVELWLSTHTAGDVVTEKDEVFAKEIDRLFEPVQQTDKVVIVKKAKLYSDGGSRGNPGPSATGYVIYDEDGQVIKQEGAYIGLTTNNQAEYLALKAGLLMAKELGVQELRVYMDSLLVVNQLNGLFKVKNRELWPIYQAVQDLRPVFKKISFNHVPRELNKIADSMVNECLDAVEARGV